jgi:hypothetical protein
MTEAFEQWLNDYCNQHRPHSLGPIWRPDVEAAWNASRAALQGQWPEAKPGVDGTYSIRRGGYTPTLAHWNGGQWWTAVGKCEPLADQHKPFAWFGPITFSEPKLPDPCYEACIATTKKLIGIGIPKEFGYNIKCELNQLWHMAQLAKEISCERRKEP